MLEPKKAVHNAADKQQVKRAKLDAKEAYRQLLRDIKAVMGTSSGRNVLSEIMYGLSRVNAKTASKSGSDTYFYEGRRAIGRELRDLIVFADFTALQLMELEYVEANTQEIKEVAEKEENKQATDEDNEEL